MFKIGFCDIFYTIDDFFVVSNGPQFCTKPILKATNLYKKLLETRSNSKHFEHRTIFDLKKCRTFRKYLWSDFIFEFTRKTFQKYGEKICSFPKFGFTKKLMTFSFEIQMVFAAIVISVSDKKKWSLHL